MNSTEDTGIRWGTGAARGVLATTILGSGMAMLDGTIVNVALPRIGTELNASVAGLQWILDGYLLALAALILVAGSLGDLYGRRRMLPHRRGLVRRRVRGCAPPRRPPRCSSRCGSCRASAAPS